MWCQVKHHWLDICLLSVDLIDGDDKWNMVLLSEVDDFDSLLLNWFDSWNHQYNHIGDSSSSRPHVLEGFVTWRINKCNLISRAFNFFICVDKLDTRNFYRKSADCLCNRTIFLTTFIMVSPKSIQQGSLTVIYMPHNSNNWSSLSKLVWAFWCVN